MFWDVIFLIAPTEVYGCENPLYWITVENGGGFRIRSNWTTELLTISAKNSFLDVGLGSG